MAAMVGGVLMVGIAFAFEPVTRNWVAVEPLCSYCHLEWEFVPKVRMSWTKPHPLEPKKDQKQVRCVECHVLEGFMGSVKAYLHFASLTDLFGHFRDLEFERSGEWIPPRAATAYRVRDRMFEYDSITCRPCHDELEPEPKRKRGKKAHKKALDKKLTCIECHLNLVHRQVDIRKTALMKPETQEGETQIE